MHQSSTKHKKIYNTHVVELKRLAQVVVARIVWGRGGFSVIHCVYGVVIFVGVGPRSAGRCNTPVFLVVQNYEESESDFLVCASAFHSRKGAEYLFSSKGLGR